MRDVGGWRELGIAVLLQAARDVNGNDELKALDAALWLVSDDVPLWLEAVGLPDVDAPKIVTTGKMKRLEGGANRMSDDVLKVFEGLTDSQVKELRRRILETLPKLRREVLEKESANGANRRKSTPKTPRRPAKTGA